jgi:LysR family transcriptional regulator, regulator of abg operon
MTLIQIRSFLAVVSCGSFRRAAAELGVSQAGLTTSVQCLEATIGGKLLTRSCSGVELTPLGKRIIVRAQTIDREVSQALREADELRGSPGGTLQVGLGPTPTAVLLHLVVPEFHAKYPTVRLQLHSGFYEQLRPSLSRGEIELAITAAPDGPASPDLERRVLFRSELAVIARVGHPLAKHRKLADLSGCEWILWGTPGGPGGTITRFHEEQGLPKPRVAATCETVTQLTALIQATDWLAMVPAVLLQKGLVGAQMTRIQIDDAAPTFENCILYRKGVELSTAARAFSAMCESAGRVLARSRHVGG